MTRTFLCAIAIVLAALPAAAQDRLAPVTTEDGILAGYEANVREVLREAFAPEVAAAALVYPSFEPEFAVGLRRAGQGREIFVVRASRQIWTYTLVELMQQGQIGVMTADGRDSAAEEIARLTEGLPERPVDLALERCAVPISEDEARAIAAAWRAMLEDIGPSQEPGLDGVTYWFSMTLEDRSLAGEIWTPVEGTRTEQLTRVADGMRAYCETRERRRLEEVLEAARALNPR